MIGIGHLLLRIVEKRVVDRSVGDALPGWQIRIHHIAEEHPIDLTKEDATQRVDIAILGTRKAGKEAGSDVGIVLVDSLGVTDSQNLTIAGAHPNPRKFPAHLMAGDVNRRDNLAGLQVNG